jgi:hypothetical protein
MRKTVSQRFRDAVVSEHPPQCGVQPNRTVSVCSLRQSLVNVM